MLFVLIGRHKNIKGKRKTIMSHDGRLPFWHLSDGVTYTGRSFLLFGFPSGFVLWAPWLCALKFEGRGETRVWAKSDGRRGRTREERTVGQKNKGWRRATQGCRWWEGKKTVRQVNEERQARATSSSHTDGDEVWTVEEEELHPILWQRVLS